MADWQLPIVNVGPESLLPTRSLKRLSLFQIVNWQLAIGNG
jgi:hypothetical protein